MATTTTTPYESMAGRIHPALLASLQSKGYNYMTPVQQRVLTELPDFTSDCLVQAKTGTGKTLAFLLPTVHSLLSSQHARKGDVSILILSPTRELAMQIKAECDMLTTQTKTSLQCHIAVGGTARDRYLKEFLNGTPAVLVATPGRLKDYLSDDSIAEKFSNIRSLILDEADTMLEAGFMNELNEILRRLPPKSAGWQGLCFSATIPDKIKPVLGKVLRSDYTSLSTVDPNEVPTIDQVDQYSIIIPSVSETFTSLAALIAIERQQNQGLKAIIFGTTANGVGFLFALFSKVFGHETKVFELHSRLSQSARTRTTAEYKDSSSGLMFASDVIGRGLDFPNVDLVIQLGLPSSGEQYVHRVGRTARAGKSGRAVIMLTEREKYFLTVNKYLPIRQYTIDITTAAQQMTSLVQQALSTVDEKFRAKAYQAYLGFHKTFLKQLRLDTTSLVGMANEYSAAMGCPEPPMVDKQVVGKMGLRGVHGLNVGVVDRQPRGPGRARQTETAGDNKINRAPPRSNDIHNVKTVRLEAVAHVAGEAVVAEACSRTELRLSNL
ncbi:hypothetical protein AMS68_003890 [Peltaster fructicola]|uniref:ATP-dependent RNA helicase n=1 Tax=Peltaster fructicola TaxID=286661 RepID=A0A6H0XUG5_9PEZI|nr:hypothetical protein AMS68_003890 [Peltaster fructicola]